MHILNLNTRQEEKQNKKTPQKMEKRTVHTLSTFVVVVDMNTLYQSTNNYCLIKW